MNRKHGKRRQKIRRAAIALLLLIVAAAYPRLPDLLQELPAPLNHLIGGGVILPDGENPSQALSSEDPEGIPSFSGHDYVELNENVPCFTEYDLTHTSGENYSELDALGRCGPAVALLDSSMMPTQERGEIGQIRPSGWQTVKYPELIEDNYLYNRCHLIAYAMTGQNDDPRNLITGTRHMNITGMLPFERKVLRYLDQSEGPVLYRVTPCFKGTELVARGVEMEAYSAADHGQEVCFHVFVYNYQPGIVIDYETGNSHIQE